LRIDLEDFKIMLYLLMFLGGICAGFMNTLAGGGSLLVLPIMILGGIPASIANATNRVAILVQNATAVYKFREKGVLDVKPVIHITIAAIIGSIAGSLTAVKIESHFDKILGFIFILVLIAMFTRSRLKSKQKLILPRWLEFIIFLLVGFYGGFIQAGVGFIFLATLNLIEQYDLIRANALKVFIIMCYTVFALSVFAFSGKIIWLYGLILALGNSIGAFLAVKLALKKGEKLVRIVLVVAVTIACAKLFGLFDLLGIS